MRRSQRTGAFDFPTGAAENNYLITRLDPFHDRPFTPTGGPGTAPTVVRVYKRTATFSAPTAGGRWSMAVATGTCGLPILTAANTPSLILRSFTNGYGNQTNGVYETNYQYGAVNSIASYSGSGVQASGPIVYPIAPISATAVNSPNWQATETVTENAGAFTFNPAGSSNVARRVALFGENVYGDGPSKLISMAFEVHMAASDLYNSGTVTVGRVPQAIQFGNIRVNTGTGTNAIYGSTSSAVLPTNSGDLLLYSGSKQWPAKYGCYCVAPGASSDTPDFDPTPFVNHNMRTQSWQDAANNAATTYSICVSSHLRDGSPYIASTEHFDTVMAMFEGLDSNATLTITTSLIYETIPSDSEALRPLARLPMQMKPMIEEVLAKMFVEVECFCMVNENASGKFFGKLRAGFNTAVRVLGSKPVAAFVNALPPTPIGVAAKQMYGIMAHNANSSNMFLSKKNQAAIKAQGGYPPPPPPRARKVGPAPGARTKARRKARAVTGPRKTSGKSVNPSQAMA